MCMSMRERTGSNVVRSLGVLFWLCWAPLLLLRFPFNSKKRRRSRPWQEIRGIPQIIKSRPAVCLLIFLNSFSPHHTTAGMYPTETEAMVQKTKGFVTGLLTKNSPSDYTANNFKTFQRVVVDPNPSRDVAYPTARLLGPEVTEEEVKKAPFRPHILTDSINPPVTPRHGAGEVGVFLYRNGFSEDPLNAIVSRDKLCRSPDALASTLSAEVDEEWGCTEAGGCRVFLHNGWEVSNCEELVEDDKLWLVPRHREFMWPTFKRGHLVEVQHVASGNGEPIVVETLSESPKVFRLNNFFTSEEADELIDNALNLNDPINGLHRSTTGQGDAAQEDSHRTSDNAWDMVSPASLRLKRRIFELLGIRPYNNAWADGLQILRYNTTQAYNSHFDYLETTPTGRLNSARRGGANRFATVVVYLTDVEVGERRSSPKARHWMGRIRATTRCWPR